MIGLPASEAFNSLIIPAAGHELGHSVWKVGDYDKEFSEKVASRIVKLIQTDFWNAYHDLYSSIDREKIDDKEIRPTWNYSYLWTMRQLQEIFCDIIGLGIFGEAYLHAFKYLIAPTASDTRFETYPASKRRAEYLAEASESLTIPVPSDFITSFKNEPAADDSPHYLLRLEISDRCTSDFFDDIQQIAIKLLRQKNFQVPSRDRWQNISDEFRKFVPVSGALGLAEIINAGWDVYHGYDSFLPEPKSDEANSEPQLECRRLAMINELVLKSVEIYEIELKLQEVKQKENS